MVVKRFKELSVFKTAYFNFKMLNFKKALKFPVFIGKRTKFISLEGTIDIEKPLKRGMIRFGFGDVGIIDKKYTRTLIEINGKLVFRGASFFGNGSKISVGKNGILDIGNNFCISANSTIICFDSVTFGDDVLFSWEVLVMDTDFHETINTETLETNTKITKPIKLGNNTWIGTRAILLKGTEVPNNCIIAANSLLNKSYNTTENCILAGNPARLKKENIQRKIH